VEPLVDAAWLAAHIDDPDLRLIDFRWYLDGRRGRDAYNAGHLPGAVFVDMDDVTAESGPGRHPVPSPERFAAAMRAAGVSRRSLVVVYDDAGGSIAARLWWLLRHFGHSQGAVLDGGLQAWPGELSTATPSPAPGDLVAEARPGEVVDLEAVRARAPGVVLLDARAGERYRGETEPIDPLPGHIPTALSAPTAGNLGADGRVLPPADLAERFRSLGADRRTVVTSCGSGVAACHNALALRVAGMPDAILYDGSYSDWSTAGYPIATGPEPGEPPDS
jgi:thiosulfate/3-mercaptopyruvate sulfurtransferase